MQEFIKYFEREKRGLWACVEKTELALPQGRIQVTAGTRFMLGSKFMGVELAKLLEDQFEKNKPHRP